MDNDRPDWFSIWTMSHFWDPSFLVFNMDDVSFLGSGHLYFGNMGWLRLVGSLKS